LTSINTVVHGIFLGLVDEFVDVLSLPLISASSFVLLSLSF
jgi:hypothetical protein